MKFTNALIGASPLDYVELARASEAAGFASVSLSDHVFSPRTLSSAYPYTPDGKPIMLADEDWLDPWVAIGAMAAVTTTLEFMTNVYILPLRNPFVVAKAVGTAAVLSGDRVSLGIGAGWMKEEFDQLEQSFSTRGKRMNEMIDVLRLLWSGGMVEHRGDHYDFDPLEMRPAPSKPVPIIVGGHSDAALRRAAQRGDGWIGVAYGVEELMAHCERLSRMRDDAGRADEPFEIYASPQAAPSPGLLAELAAAGVTSILTSAQKALAPGSDPHDLPAAKEAIAKYSELFLGTTGSV
ncbi:MAG: LLM class F420-dependent oxidoreductase [Acidimicrobiales bacterium]